MATINSIWIYKFSPNTEELINGGITEEVSKKKQNSENISLQTVNYIQLLLRTLLTTARLFTTVQKYLFL